MILTLQNSNMYFAGLFVIITFNILLVTHASSQKKQNYFSKKATL